jgi:hypothetical protein
MVGAWSATVVGARNCVNPDGANARGWLGSGAMKHSLAFALVLVPLFGACASKASTRETRSNLVASDIERDLVRVDANLAAAEAYVKSVEAGDRRARLDKLLAAATAERENARLELAAYSANKQVEHVHKAAEAASLAGRLARAAERGEDLLALD